MKENIKYNSVELPINKRVRKTKPKLPRNWKALVVETLAGQGIQLNEVKVYNLAKGRVKDPVAAKQVILAMRNVAEKYTAELAELQAIKKETVFV